MEKKEKLKVNNVILAGALFVILFIIPVTVTLVRIGFNPFTKADPALQPQNIIQALNWNTSITIIFETPGKEAVSIIKYGTAADNLNFIAKDLRDPAINSEMHYINLENLTSNTTYYYKIVVNNNNEFDNNGTPFTFKTLNIAATPTPGLTDDIATGSVAPVTGNCIIYAHAVNGTSSTSQTVTTYTSSNGTFTILRDMFLDKYSAEKVSFSTFNKMLVFAKCNNTVYGGKIVTITDDIGQITFDSVFPVKFYDNNLKNFSGGSLPTVTAGGSTSRPSVTIRTSQYPTATSNLSPSPTSQNGTTIFPSAALPHTALSKQSTLYVGIMLLLAGGGLFAGYRWKDGRL
ncbi:MAG: fibronectin type III domain-containing protein [bacterium]